MMRQGASPIAFNSFEVITQTESPEILARSPFGLSHFNVATICNHHGDDDQQRHDSAQPLLVSFRSDEGVDQER